MKKETFGLYLVALLIIMGHPAQAQRTKVISLQKTACYGTCPIFVMDIYSNCKVILEAEKFVNVGEGTFKSKLTRGQMDTLKQKFEKSEFFEFEESYSSNVTDLPTTFLYYNNGSQDMKIEMYGDRPAKLEGLDAYLMELMGNLKWKNVKSK
jgi:hypothetical protein